MRLRLSERVAGAAASTVGITSFIDGWARIESTAGEPVALISGDPGFDAFTAYLLAVGVAIAGAFFYVGFIVARELGPPSRKARYVGVGISAAVLGLLLYGIWEGPSGVLDAVPGGAAEGSFAIKRGSLLYIATAAAAAVFAASAVGVRAPDNTKG